MNNKLSTRLAFLLLGIVLISLGNSLSILSLAGNGLWTAAAVQLSLVTHSSIKIILIIIGLIALLANSLLTKFNWLQSCGELVFVFFFGNLVNLFIHLFHPVTTLTNTMFSKTLLAILGIIIVCLGTSIYQRVNLWMYPTDHLTALLYHHFFKSNFEKAQIITFLIPICIILITSYQLKSLQGIQIGTLFSLIMNGKIIKISNQYLFPFLKFNID
ncbi:hypothetical protein [Fructobacillus ficulneus]|uniref:hypothetical protein n=1 Tax=Fructobacillus ficulneus TaxID=157463 RepID=UPI000782B95E|nr:hypothetical protein [Fructobacillus ficulneus]